MQERELQLAKLINRGYTDVQPIKTRQDKRRTGRKNQIKMSKNKTKENENKYKIDIK